MRALARGILIAMVLMAVFADFLAGQRPIIMSVDGDVETFAEAPESLGKKDWALWPPIRFDPRSVRGTGRLAVLQAPGGEHLLGTDDRGRDVASRLIHGARISVFQALACAFVATLLGTGLALLASAARQLDTLVLTLCDVLAAVPLLLVVLVVRGLVGAESMASLVLLICVPRAASTARLVRESLRAALAQPYCEAALAIGCTPWRRLLRHALPASQQQLRVAAALTASTAVLAEVALSFLGLGVSGASWGELLRQAHHNQLAYWLLVPGGLATALLAWSFGQAAE